MDKYKIRGVSSKKEDVHNALKDKIDKGLFPDAFCKIVEDFLGNSKDYCNIMHADGAGTKSSLAYIYYKETGDLSVFKGIAMDSLVMNIDDLLCVGVYDNFLISNTIGRNSKFISGEIIKTIIHAYEEIIEWFNSQGITMKMTGGETADVGDVVRTLIVDSTAVARTKRENIITNEKIRPGLIIIGLASSGRSSYENEYNSGIGSNGLTSARHDLFNKIYIGKYPESLSPDIPSEYAYCGPYKLTDTAPELPINVGKAALSPTRTYSPIIKEILQVYRDKIGGIIHCTGGGQTKCLNFGRDVHYIKNNLFKLPPIFKMIHEASNTSYNEMYQVFNMGHRMELYVEESIADKIIGISDSLGVEAKVVGEIKESTGNKLTIHSPEGIIKYNK